jgi:hypothetical protein
MNRTASSNVNPTVAGLTCNQRKYTNTITDTMAADWTKRTIGFNVDDGKG